MKNHTTLWHDRAFVLFWIGRSTSVGGSIITSVVLPILIFQLTGSALQTSILSSLQVIPYFVFGLLAGALADRVNRRRLMIGCDLINVLLLGSIPVATAFNSLTLNHIYLVALFSATAFVWFDAANFGALPTLVGQERIVEANSTIWSTSTILGIVGPSVGGFLAATMGAAETISIDALSYLISAVCLALIPRSLNSYRNDATPTPFITSHILPDIREGLNFIWNHPLVRSLTLLGFGVSFTGGAISSLLVVFAVQGLGLAENDGRIGLLYTAGAVGALCASLLLPRLVNRYSVGQITLFGMIATLFLHLVFTRVTTLLMALPIYLLWDGFYTLVIINGISLRQIVTPEHLQSRVNATARMIAWGGSPFGAAVGGALAELLDIRAAYLFMSIGLALSVIIGWFSPLRHYNFPSRSQNS